MKVHEYEDSAVWEHDGKRYVLRPCDADDDCMVMESFWIDGDRPIKEIHIETECAPVFARNMMRIRQFVLNAKPNDDFGDFDPDSFPFVPIDPE
jgi:hypothetical protein